MAAARMSLSARTAKALEQLIERVERSTALDPVGAAIANAARTVIRPGPVEDSLSGVAAGHPVHPVLVTVPIGAWTSALLLDLTGADATTTRRLIGLGTATALPAATTGLSDWLSTAEAERRVGLVHAAINDVAVGAQLASWLLRRRGRTPLAVVLSAAGVALVSVGGWLGGHLAYAQGVGVDTTAFQKLPSEWVDVAAVDDVVDGELLEVQAAGVPVLLTRVDGAVVALADRCTHRGAPLHEGEVADGCIACPWHGSVFDAHDGAVVSGPAVRPQPRLEVSQVDGRIRVRRDETRALRLNPAGV